MLFRSYLTENNIDLVSLAAGWMKPSEDPLYALSTVDFSRIVKMPLRRLKYQRYEFEKEREEIFERKMRQDQDKETADRAITIERGLSNEDWKNYQAMRTRIHVNSVGKR